MTQNYVLAALTDYANGYLAGQLNNNLEALRTCFSGGSEPTTPTPLPGQLWADTSAGLLKMRNAAGTGWVKVARLAADQVLQLSSDGWAGSLSASKTAWLGSCPRLGTVRRLVLVSDTATTSSSGNEYTFQLRKYPAATPGSPVDLFSAAAGTFTNVAGVGGGSDFVANAAVVLTPDQNATVADLDQLELVVVAAGTVTTIADFRAIVEVE